MADLYEHATALSYRSFLPDRETQGKIRAALTLTPPVVTVQ
jgi:hypothetical protein